jgi:hypothetical protein
MKHQAYTSSVSIAVGYPVPRFVALRDSFLGQSQSLFCPLPATGTVPAFGYHYQAQGEEHGVEDAERMRPNIS